ncbi:MAG: hypothetical protein LQ345_003927 [Seirophora villosa]|nr:MAG: hypothetical protein LQ345_003927 [Seirophora villosa]
MSNNTDVRLPGEGESHQSRSSRPPSQKSRKSSRSNKSRQSAKHSHPSEESAPLLSGDVDHRNYGDAPDHDNAPSTAASTLRSLQEGESRKGKKSRRWPSIIALTILTLVLIAILGLGFAAPEVAEQYAKEAMVFEPTDLSIDSFTSSGVRARIQGNFRMDASKVHKKPVRDLGRAGTWIARAVESKRTKVEVFLPELSDVLLGSADIPPIVVDIRNGHTTHLDFVSELTAGDLDGIRRVAEDWLDGRLGQLRVRGSADVGIKSGIFSLGTQTLSEEIMFKANQIPVVPKYKIGHLGFSEGERDGAKGMLANVSLTLKNDYPVDFEIPRFRFDILVPGCLADAGYLALAEATTAETQVSPKSDVDVNVSGFVRELPETLIAACPDTQTSPIDRLLGSYVEGKETLIYVRGSSSPSSGTPRWIIDFMKDVVVPVPFLGHEFKDLIRNFTLADVHFGLPDPFASPDSPQSNPRISAVVKALINLPEEIQFPIDVARVRADADVYYEGRKLGELDLHKWQHANSTRMSIPDEDQEGLLVQSIVKEAPLNITDDDVFADVIQALVFGGTPVVLGVQAQVDVESSTVLGTFVVRDIPAQGKVFVKPISGGNVTSFSPEIGELEILETSRTTLTIGAKVNVTNPTEYAATVPYVDINISVNDTILGHATARDVSVVPGPNHNLAIVAVWNPSSQSGNEGAHVGRELLSQYISGYNTSLTLRTHPLSIPSQPHLGATLSIFNVTIPTPQLKLPPNPNRPIDQDPPPSSPGPHFIDDAVFHLITSTADLTLLSPLPHTSLYITSVSATASYNNTPVGSIDYDLPFEVPPGVSLTPRLPVDWSLGSVGYEAVKEALGGKLKVEAEAKVGIRVGRWREKVWMRNLKCVGQQIVQDVPSIEATAWDASSDSVICLRAADGLLRLERWGDEGLQPIASWDAPPTPYKVLDLHFFADTQIACIILDNGDIILVRENPAHEEKIEIVGSIDAAISAAAWSPDDETLVLTTKASTIIYLTRDFEELASVELTTRDLDVSDHVSVGWGKKETQFKGKKARALRDPTVPDTVDDGRLAETNESRETTISWRGDGAYLAVNSVEDVSQRRVIRIYSREGVLDSVSEPVNGLIGPLSWRPAGNLVAGIQLFEDKRQVVFFERNGLRHGQFPLRPLDGVQDGNEVSIRSLQWNVDSTVLAVTYDDRVQLWTMGNYHWYLKQEIMDPGLKWHPEKPLVFALISKSKDRIRRLHYSLEVCAGPILPPSDYGVVAVIDGKSLKITPLRQANIPPPMSLYDINLAANANDVMVDLDCSDDGIYRKPIFRIRVLHQTWFSRYYLDLGTMQPPLQLENSPDSGNTSPVTNGQGKLDSGLRLSLEFRSMGVASGLYKMTENGSLLANGKVLARGCTSYLVTPSHLIFTTSQHLLKFVHLVAETDALEVPPDTPESDERCRSIERGAKLVTAMPSVFAVVLQMPRGNLETIYPRALVLAGIRQSINEKKYKKAFLACRNQRVDMNILNDHQPEQFMENIRLIVDQIEKVEHIDLFLSSLRDEDVSTTMYRETLRVEERKDASASTEGGGKVNKICNAFLEALSSRKANVKNMITAQVCKNPPDLDAGLTEIVRLRGKS